MIIRELEKSMSTLPDLVGFKGGAIRPEVLEIVVHLYNLINDEKKQEEEAKLLRMVRNRLKAKRKKEEPEDPFERINFSLFHRHMPYGMREREAEYEGLSTETINLMKKSGCKPYVEPPTQEEKELMSLFKLMDLKDKRTK